MVSERLMTIFRSATHHGELADATHRGLVGAPGCGPYIALAFRVEDGVIRQARFRTYGCPTAIACAELVCTMSEGRPVARLPPVTPADLTLLVGGVPEGKEHCPELAVQALARLGPIEEEGVGRGPPAPLRRAEGAAYLPGSSLLTIAD